MSKILLVEDDPRVAESVLDALSLANHTVEWLTDGQEALDRLALYCYDVAILDIGLTPTDGLEICRQYRANGGKVPILFLTGRAAISERIAGLDAGGDDYMTKPFSVRELVARVRALLRRTPDLLLDVLSVGDLCIDLKRCIASKNGVDLQLLPKELALLEYFMRRPNQVISVKELLNRLWNSESESTSDAVWQCVARLRRKVHNGSQARILTVKGLGYKLTPRAECKTAALPIVDNKGEHPGWTA